MAGFVPIKKLSKKAQKEHNRKKRAMWTLSPVTRKVESKKLYSRKKKAHDRFDDDYGMGFFHGLTKPSDWSMINYVKDYPCLTDVRKEERT